MAPEGLTASVARLLAAVGRGRAYYELAPIPVGGNNRVFVVTSGGAKFVLKSYYRDALESHDRLAAEYDFLQVTRGCGIRCVPHPLARDTGAHAALYEFIEGRRLTPDDLDAGRVLEAARFFAELNSARVRDAGRHLPTASDSCFSLLDHLRSVDHRLERLNSIGGDTAADREAAAFVTELTVAWKRERVTVLKSSTNPHCEFPGRWRGLSPSDFGFHNALLRPSGDLCFLDFEYAGWDDPAKMIGDFFSHPGLPVPRAHFEAFAAQACAPFEDAGALIARARTLAGVARFRWCCIMLNEFRGEVARRRRFADPAVDLEATKWVQLTKAQSLYSLFGS